MDIYYIVLATIFLLLGVFQPMIETFKLKRSRPRHKVQVGTLNNTPKGMQNLMVGLNKVGGQLTADSEHDTVADEYLNKDNVE
jgi:hypothetical protein